MVLLCLAAGTTFWFLNALNKSYTTKIKYPINFIFDRDDVVVVNDLPEKVEIDVSGVGWNLLRKTFWFNVQPVNIPLNNPAEVKYIMGSSLVPFISEQLGELSLNYVVTDSLYINIDNKATSKVPVKVDSANISLQRGFRIVSPIRLSPDTVTFYGPSAYINELPDSVLVHIQEEDIEENFNAPVDITYQGPELVSYSPSEINVSFEVARFLQKSMVVPVELINFPPDSSVYLTDKQIRLNFTVREQKTKDLTSRDFKVIANFKNLNKSDSTIVPLVIKYPDFVERLTVIPPALKVNYEK